MPGFDGKGPFGQGPMTGRGRGYCVLRTSEDSPGRVDGLAGINGRPVAENVGDTDELRVPPSGTDSEIERQKMCLREHLQMLEEQKRQIEQRLSRLERGRRLVAVVQEEKCAGCGLCADVCPEHAIRLNHHANVQADVCTGCGRCALECPNLAIMLAPN